MTEFDTGLPSVKQIQGYVKDKQEVELKLVTNDLFVGKIAWQDPQSICLRDGNDTPILIWRQAIVFVKPKA